MAGKGEQPESRMDGAREWLKAHPPGSGYRAVKGWLENRKEGVDRAEVESELEEVDLDGQDETAVLASVEGVVDRLAERMGGDEAAEELLYSIQPGLETLLKKDFSDDDMDRIARKTVENGKISVIIAISLIILIARRKSKPVKWATRFVSLAKRYWRERQEEQKEH